MKSLVKLGCVLFMTAACGGGGDDGSTPATECSNDAGAVPTYSEVQAFQTCEVCHSSKLSGAARMEAPTTINFDTYEAAKANAEKAISQVHSGLMPPSSSKLTLTQTAKDDLYQWGSCGTPNG